MPKPWVPTDPATVREAEAWLRKQPKCIQEVAAEYPGGLYYNRGVESGVQRVLIFGYNSAKDGTVFTGALAAVLLDYNAFLGMERRVFDMPLKDLEGIPEHPDEVRALVNAERGGLTADEMRLLLPDPEQMIARFRERHGQDASCSNPNCALHARKES